MWKPYIRFSSFASGVDAVAKAGAHVRYLTREKECLLWDMTSFGEHVFRREDAKKRWVAVGRMETGGAPLDTKAGRSRRDGCIQVRLFLPLPNDIFDAMTDDEKRRSIGNLVQGFSLDSTDVLWSLHRGLPKETAGGAPSSREKNLHLHICYRPRGEKGLKHRISIRRSVVRLRETLALWLERHGCEIDRNALDHPGPRRHISAGKIAIAERGETLASAEEQLQADLTMAKRDVSMIFREEARRIVLEHLEALTTVEKRASLQEVLDSRGWKLSKKRRGKRTTWVLEDDAGKEYALRRILGAKAAVVDRMMTALGKIEKTGDTQRSGRILEDIPR